VTRIVSEGSAPHGASRGRAQRTAVARRWWLVLIFVGVFLTLGVPRWLQGGDAAPAGSHTAGSFGNLCRAHGGTPHGGTATNRQTVCTVRYGARVYRMDAITPHGFDADTAHYQRQGCEQAQRAQTGRSRPSFIYHPATGVCEHS
jgi:hypothetical protein